MKRRSVELGPGVEVSLQHLLTSRALVNANSGAGKSWCLRRLLEQSHGQVQQLVLDLEGEFHTLRERGDYILARPFDGDVIAHPKTARLLARELLRFRISTILDISDLKRHERFAFVRLFLESLMRVPIRERKWPVLVVVDEAHQFCPQKSQAESSAAVIDLMTRGRKRHLCGILATQRLSKLDKDAAAECNNLLIGRCALPIDQKMAAELLGFTTAEERRSLRELKPGEFYCFGPALSTTVTQVKVGPVETTHEVQVGRGAHTPAPSAKVKKALADLGDLTKRSEEEAVELADVKRQLTKARREIGQLKKGVGLPDPEEIEQLKERIVEGGRTADEALTRATVLEGERDQARRAAEKAVSLYQDLRQFTVKHLGELGERAVRDAEAFRKECLLVRGSVENDGRGPEVPTFTDKPVEIKRRGIPGPTVSKALAARPPRVPMTPSPPDGDVALNGGSVKLLNALAEVYPAKVSLAQWATLANRKPRGGSWNTCMKQLRESGYVHESGGLVELVVPDGFTFLGREVPDDPQTSDERIEMWKRALGPTSKFLDILVSVYPGSISKQELADHLGLTPRGGSWNTHLSRLKVNDLAQVTGEDITLSSWVVD